MIAYSDGCRLLKALGWLQSKSNSILFARVPQQIIAKVNGLSSLLESHCLSVPINSYSSHLPSLFFIVKKIKSGSLRYLLKSTNFLWLTFETFFKQNNHTIVMFDSFLTVKSTEGSRVCFIVLDLFSYTSTWHKCWFTTYTNSQEIDECFQTQVRNF